MATKKNVNGSAKASSYAPCESRPLGRNLLTAFGGLIVEARIPVEGPHRLKRFEDLLHPDYWKNHVAQFSPGDFIMAVAEDNSWLVVLMITFKNDYMMLLREVWRTENCEPPLRDLGELEIREVTGRWKVFAKDSAGGDMLVANFPKYETARDWAIQNRAVLSAKDLATAEAEKQRASERSV